MARVRAETEMWRNNLYIATVRRREDGSVESISVRRDDQSPVHPWRHLQWIKNDIAGPEAEAVNLHPAESRLLDTANQSWLWVLPPGHHFPMGFNEGRIVSDEVDPAQFPGAVQSPGARYLYHTGGG
jgi:hypothetical protein